MVKGVEIFVKDLEKKTKITAMLAPSFVADFDYPEIISMLKETGIDKVVELTFAAKIVNREYQNKIRESKGLMISSVCPGVVATIKNKFSQYKNNLITIDSPMIAMAKICKKIYPKNKVVFISPCKFKAIEASSSKEIDFVICFDELKELFKRFNIKKTKTKKKILFDKLYNDYTKIYPLAGGLSKTIKLKGILKNNQIKKIDGILEVIKFLEKPDKKIRFLDANFCIGGCIGGESLDKKRNLNQRKKRVLDYIKKAKYEDIPESKKGTIKKAEGINFNADYS